MLSGSNQRTDSKSLGCRSQVRPTVSNVLPAIHTESNEAQVPESPTTPRPFRLDEVWGHRYLPSRSIRSATRVPSC